MRAATQPGEPRELGTSALAVTWWGLVMMAVALAAVAGGVELAATHASARAAADAAALAGAGAHPLAGGDGDVCAAAERLADHNDAELVDCRVAGDRAATLRVAVAVTVEPAVELLRRRLGPQSAEAVAGLAPVAPADDRHARAAAALTGTRGPPSGPR